MKDFLSNLEEGLSRINEMDLYRKLLSFNNNQAKFNWINRLAIYMQIEEAYDLRTDIEWENEGREIIKGAKQIEVAYIKTINEYIDAESNRALKGNELNSREIKKALEYGIIKKIEHNEIIIQKVYDIRSTKSIGDRDEKYSLVKPELTILNVLDLFRNITGAKIIEVEHGYKYNVEKNILLIQKVKYKLVVEAVSKALAKFYMIKLKEANNKVVDRYKEYVQEATVFSISSYLNSGIDMKRDIKEVEAHHIIEILNIIDSIMENVITNMKHNKPYVIRDNNKEFIVRAKAEYLLDMMESNYMQNKLERTI